MKKILALLALVLGVVSCQTEPEGLDVNVGGEVETTVCVSLPEATRANSAVGAFENLVGSDAYTIRYIFQVFYQGNESGAARQVIYTDKETVSFPVRLVPGRHYNFVVWADVTTTAGKTLDTIHNLTIADATAADIHYNTEHLTNITLKGEWNAMDETRDAFTGFYDTAVRDDKSTYSSSKSINFTLTRPFAKLRVLTTDMQALANLGLSPRKAVVKYNANHYSSFDACTGQPTNKDIVEKVHTIADVATYGEAGTLFVDYFFATEAQETIKFELTVYDQNGNEEVNKIKYNNFNTDIAVQRNYLTTIQGNILTDGNNVTVTVEENGAFANDDNTTDEPYYYQTISSEAELLAAIDNGGEYIVVSDIVVTGNSVSTLAATRAAGATTINLNGYTITLKADVEIPAGKTVIITDINENGEVGAIVSENDGAIVNNGTLNIEGGHFGANTIENNNGVVNITGGTISQGAITGGANITGGEFTYNPENEIPDGYKVVETENGKYEVRVGDPIAKIGDVEYTTIQAAIEAAEGETTIQLMADVTVKNTIVLAEGKNITLNLATKTLSAADKNVIRNDGGTLTIQNGTITRTGDVVGYSVNNASGEITVENATITRGLYTSGSKMTATNANISHDQSSRHAIYAYNCEVTINSGTYHNDNAGNATLMASGSSVVTIEDGEFSIADGRSSLGWTSSMIDQNGTAKVIVKGGLFNGGFRINSADTTLTIEGGEFNTNNGSNYTDYSGTKVVKGGKFTDDGAKNWAKKYIADGYVLDGDEVVLDVKVAKVGTTEYRNIDDAIAAWTNNTTLTLMSDVTLTDVITLKSTEHHILDLGTYTMKAATDKNAFVIKACGTGDAERTAITIKADATNPGSINAGSKCIVYYKYADGGISGNDRPIIKIEGGIFNGSTSSWGTAGIYTIGSEARKCATLNISGGTFNCSINGSGKSKLIISGGLFHHSVGSQGDSTALRLISGGTFKTLGFMTADSNNTKFWFGTSMANSNVGLYINDDNYLVVGGPVITEFGDKFAAKATNPTKWSSYLQYSSAATNGLYYTNAEMAIKKHDEANVVLK